MALTVPAEGETCMLGTALGKTAVEVLSIHLYNAISEAISDSTTKSHFTECTGTGYASKTITASEWTITNGAAQLGEQTFTWSAGPETVLGYYIEGDTSNKIWWAEAFSSSASIPAGGGSVKLTLNISLE